MNKEKCLALKSTIYAGILGGIVSGFVKTGVARLLPPRIPGRIAPPIQILNDIGIHAQSWVYHYSGHTINFAGSGVHYLFSVFFALLYCALAEYYPRIMLWRGMAYGLVITVIFHVIVLPFFGWSPAIWECPLSETVAEVAGHLVWAYVIDVFRRYFRCEIMKVTDIGKNTGVNNGRKNK